MGLYRPTVGAILIDGIDQRQIDPAELRRQIGYVQQDVMLFYGSLRENITLGAPLADDAELVRAAAVGGLLEMVNAHPQGFDLQVGERGESLSGGQRQGWRSRAPCWATRPFCCSTSRPPRWTM